MSKSKYAIRMARLSNRIFGEVVRSTDKKSMKVVKMFRGMPANLNPEVINYYPRHRELLTLMNGLRYHGLFRDEAADFKEEMKRRLEVRGKTKAIPEKFIKRKEETARRRAEEAAGTDRRVNLTS